MARPNPWGGEDPAIVTLISFIKHRWPSNTPRSSGAANLKDLPLVSLPDASVTAMPVNASLMKKTNWFASVNTILPE